jgi:chromosome segregation ATPase
MVKSRVKAIGNAAFSAADDSLGFVNAKMDRVKVALDKSRQRVGWISRAAERLKDEKADARKECEPLLQALDEVFQQLNAAESWLDSSYAVASGVSRVSEAVVSSEYAASHEDSAGIAISKRTQELSESVAEILAKLQIVRQKLIDLRDTGKLAREVVATVVAHVADLDGKLAMLSARLEKFDNKVTQTKASVDAVHRRFRWWIRIAVVALTILMAWFGISQIGMIGHAWRCLRSDLKSTAAPAPTRPS